VTEAQELEAAARRVLAAWGEWADTVCYDHHDEARAELRRSMWALAAALPDVTSLHCGHRFPDGTACALTDHSVPGLAALHGASA
jgi:hypothetical protein